MATIKKHPNTLWKIPDTYFKLQLCSTSSVLSHRSM